MSEQIPPPDMIPWSHAGGAMLAAACAVAIRLTGADTGRSLRTVAADAVGTIALFFLLFSMAYGSGLNAWLSVGVAGVGAAGGWVVVYGMLQRAAEKRLGL